MNEHEELNVKAALDGYRNGDIPYSDNYTLIYAGKIVDTASTYNEFTDDRLERLTRYRRDYGDGTLWYESGLKISPQHMPRQDYMIAIHRNSREEPSLSSKEASGLI